MPLELHSLAGLALQCAGMSSAEHPGPCSISSSSACSSRPPARADNLPAGVPSELWISWKCQLELSSEGQF